MQQALVSLVPNKWCYITRASWYNGHVIDMDLIDLFIFILSIYIYITLYYYLYMQIMYQLLISRVCLSISPLTKNSMNHSFLLATNTPPNHKPHPHFQKWTCPCQCSLIQCKSSVEFPNTVSGQQEIELQISIENLHVFKPGVL